MGEFVMLGNGRSRLADQLVQLAPSFGASDEFRALDEAGVELVSLVFGAFRRFVERVHADASESAFAREARAAIEQLASSPDAEVQNWLVVDVFEHLELPDHALDGFVDSLGPAARLLYDKWIGPMA